MDSNQKVYDFYNGLEHLENSKIIFIGDFKKKVFGRSSSYYAFYKILFII